MRQESFPWYFRPRILYISLFAWVSVTGGRFLAPFLEHQVNFPAQEIGWMLALYQAVLALTGSLGGVWADLMEIRHPGKGRALVLCIGLLIGTIVFLLHDTSSFFPSRALFSSTLWFALLRCLYAVSASLIWPVLDGMTLAFLDHLPNSSPGDYGKERLYGAISWAVTHMMIAMVLDWKGFVVTYPLAIVSFAFVLQSVAIYVHGQAVRERILHKQKSDITDNIMSTMEDDILKEGQENISFGFLLFQMIFGTSFALAFAVGFLCLSIGQVVVESLVFLYFEFLGSAYAVMGVTVILTVAFEIPIFHVAPKLLERFGSGALLLTAAACYGVRVVAYSVIPQGHVQYAFLLEPLHGITYGCAQTAAVDFAAQRVPKGCEATGQSIVSIARALGSIVGLLWGGWGSEMIGPRLMYRISAAIVVLGNLGLACNLSLSCNCAKSPSHKPVPVLDEDDGVENIQMTGLEGNS